MATFRLVLILLLVIPLAACGDDRPADKPGAGNGSGPSTPGSGGTPSPSGPGPDAPAEPSAGEYSATGVVKALGPSIHMQGTHQLVEEGRTVALLQSKAVDLTKFEGKRVTVFGKAEPTVEGKQTIVTVSRVEPVK
jgi:hypothetical protein